MMRLSVTLDVAAAPWKKAFTRAPQKMEEAAAMAFLNAKKPVSFKDRRFEINVLLTDDKNVRTLNKNYRGKDKPTNALSFPQLEIAGLKKKDLDIFPLRGNIPLGDVVLALQTIKREAKEQGKTVEAHTLHLVIHGVLHLLGYDHMRAKDAKIMEKLECDILASLGYPDPYHDR